MSSEDVNTNQQPLGLEVPIRKVLSDEWHFNTRNSILGFTNPLSANWFFSVIGSEYCHTYFWIAKDLAWMQSWRHFSIFFGLMALGWSLLILYHAMRTLNWHELWNFVALFLWLFANFWWMIGEAHDYEYPEEFPVATQHSNTCAHILEVAFVWVLLYYVVILPCNLLQCNKASLAEYDDNKLKPRLSCFKNFRQYENLHMLFWIAKDLAWNRMSLPLWFLFLVPTLLISADFILISASTPCDDSTVDTVHFTVMLMWVVGNSVWAFGDFFFDDYDEPMRMWIRSEISLKTARWYSSWILFSAVVPILIMYGVWGTLTLTGRLRALSTPRGGRMYGSYSSVANNWLTIQDIDGQNHLDGALSMDSPVVTQSKNSNNNAISVQLMNHPGETVSSSSGKSLASTIMSIVTVTTNNSSFISKNDSSGNSPVNDEEESLGKEPDEYTGLLEKK